MRHVLTIVCTLITTALYSIDFKLIKYTTENGLPSNETYQVFQDSKGYIWIATDNGAVRWDGYNFKILSRSNGLPDKTIFGFFEDYKQRIWFISFNGKLSYWENNRVVLYKHNAVLKSLLKKTTMPIKQSFYVDSLDNVFFSDKNNGLFKISDNGNAHSYPNDAIIHYEKGRLLTNFYGNSKNDSAYIRKAGKLIKSNLYINKGYQQRIYTLKYNNSILVTTNYFISKLVYSKVVKTKKLSGIIYWVCADSKKKIWAGTAKGAYCLNAKLDTLEHLFPNYMVSSVMEDREGGYWFSTIRNGVIYIPNKKVTGYKLKQFSSKNVSSITEGEGSLWINCGNYNIVQIKNNRITNYTLPSVESIDFKLFDLKYDCNSNKLLFLHAGINSLKNNIFEYHREKKLPYHQDGNRIQILNNGEVWCSGQNDLVHWIDDKLESRFIINEPNLYIQDFLKISNDTFLIASRKGLYELDIASGVYKKCNEKLLSEHLTCLTINKQNQNVWFGSREHGIIVKKKDSIVNFTPKNGLGSSYITSVFYHKNKVWVGTKNKGLNIIFLGHHGEIEHIEHYTFKHGLFSNTINAIHVNDTAAYIGTNNGLNIIKNQDIIQKKIPPMICIDKVMISGSDTIVKQEYSLPYNKNTIEVVCTGIAYKCLGKVGYKYLLGSNNSSSRWVEAKDRTITLLNLQPGNYVLAIKAVNESNVESAAPIYVRLNIEPPFWQTWWFRTFILIIIIIIVVFITSAFYRVKISEAEKRGSLTQQIDGLKYKALANQMNPHFIFNCLASIQNYVRENDNKQSSRYITQFASLMRSTLDNSHYSTITLEKELQALKNYIELEAMRLEGKFSYDLKISEELAPEDIRIPPLILQPFVENAIIHGLANKIENGNLTVKLASENKHLLCVIDDDGIGREAAQELIAKKRKFYRSYGTEITIQRLELINKLYGHLVDVKYIDKTEKGSVKGTRLELRIPIISN